MFRNHITIIGRLTAEPKLAHTKESNKSVCNVIVAVNDYHSDDAEFFHVVLWGKNAENLCTYKTKGDLVGVSGRIKTRSYTDKNNVIRSIAEIIGEEIDFLGYTKKGKDKNEPMSPLNTNGQTQEEMQMIYDAMVAEDDDLPF